MRVDDRAHIRPTVVDAQMHRNSLDGRPVPLEHSPVEIDHDR